MAPVFRRAALPAVLALFVLLALAYSVVLPLGESPDEVTHFYYIQSLRENGRPPTGGPGLPEAHQPPLYYLLGAAVTAWVPVGDFQVIANPDFQLGGMAPNLLLHTRREGFPYGGEVLAWHLVRALSILFGAITVWATWKTARELLEDEPLALSAAALVAFLPGFISLSAAINNDNLVIMLASLAVYQVTRILKTALAHDREAPTSSRSALITLGVMLGLAALTKWSAFVLWAFAAMIMVYVGRRSNDRRRTTIDFVLCFAIASLFLAPWALYSQINYGDPLGLRMGFEHLPLRTSPLSATDWQSLLSGLYTSFWGRFGGAINLSLPTAVYWGWGVVALLAMAGLVLSAFTPSRRSREALALPAVLFALFWAILSVSWLRYTWSILGTDQARLLFPGLPLLSTLFVAGLAGLVTPRPRLAAGAAGAALFATAIFTLWMLISAYGPPSQSQQPASNQAIDFGRTILIRGYTIDTNRVAPGQAIKVRFDWQSINATDEDYWLLLRLGNGDQAEAQKDGVPSGGRLTTDWWRPGQTFDSVHALTVPRDIAPGSYELQVGLHPFGRWEWLKVKGKDMLTLGTIDVVETGWNASRFLISTRPW